MFTELYNELKDLANENRDNCISEDKLLMRADEAGLSILEISKLTDKLVSENVMIVSSEDYKKAIEGTRTVNPESDADIQKILKLFNVLSGEKRKACIRILNDKMKAPDDKLYFDRNNGIGGRGIGRVDDKGFWVMKGSYIYPFIASYVPTGVVKARERYASVIDEYGILQEDVFLSSPSYAAAFVCGKNTNGLAEWKNRYGVPLKVLNDKLTDDNISDKALNDRSTDDNTGDIGLAEHNFEIPDSTYATLKVGEIFTFGKYNRMPIKWIVLSKNNSTLFVISSDIVCKRRFDGRSNNWENSEMRRWLNGEFYQECFTAREKKFIQVVEKDNVTLITEEKAMHLMSQEQRSISNWWWMLSPDSGNNRFVSYMNGCGLPCWTYVDVAGGGVRPNLHLKF